MSTFARSRFAGRLRAAWPALRIVWWILSFVAAGAVVAPFVLPEVTIFAVSAALQEPGHVPGSCSLCGMTRAFVCIARGDVAAALSLNRGSIFVVAALTLNAAFAATSLVCGVRGARYSLRFPTRSEAQSCKS